MTHIPTFCQKRHSLDSTGQDRLLSPRHENRENAARTQRSSAFLGISPPSTRDLARPAAGTGGLPAKAPLRVSLAVGLVPASSIEGLSTIPQFIHSLSLCDWKHLSQSS